MALKHFLNKYPRPQNPCVYTGLFAKPLSEREWSDRPNKYKEGVSYTQFADAYDIDLGLGLSLFNMIHGNCSYFADYFWYRNPDWKEMIMMRGTFWDTIIHVYCVKETDGKTLFADARGITDDPVTFFSDFTCSESMYVREVYPKERVSETWFTDAYRKAYEHIYGKAA